MGKIDEETLDEARAEALETAAQAIASIDRRNKLERELFGRTARPSAAGAELLFRLARTELKQVKEILSFGAQRADELFAVWRERADDLARRHGRPPIPVQISGTKASAAKGSLSLENRRSRPVQISFRPTRVRNRVGGECVTVPSPMAVAAAPPLIPAGGSSQITVSVDLSDAFFDSKVSDVYFAEVEVVILGEVADRLAVEVTLT